MMAVNKWASLYCRCIIIGYIRNACRRAQIHRFHRELIKEEELHRARSVVERKCQVVGTASKEQQADRQAS